jgi:hypothetical protein
VERSGLASRLLEALEDVAQLPAVRELLRSVGQRYGLSLVELSHEAKLRAGWDWGDDLPF